MPIETKRSGRLRMLVPVARPSWSSVLGLCALPALVAGCGARLERDDVPARLVAATPDLADGGLDATGHVDATPAIDGSETSPPPYDGDIVTRPEPESPHAWATGKLCDATVASGTRPMMSLESFPIIDARSLHGGAVWTGTDMLVVGDERCLDAPPCPPRQAVFAYDPATDQWRFAVEVDLSGEQVNGPLVHMGGENVARVDTSFKTAWVSRDLHHAAARRFDALGTCINGASAVGWAPSTDELVIWGGGTWDDGPSWIRCADGIALKDGVARKIAPPPATMRGGNASAVTMGGSLLFVSWDDLRIARYESDVDRWIDLGALPAITGRDQPAALAQLDGRLAFFGGLRFDGNESSFVALDGASFDVSTSGWTKLEAAPPTALGDHWRDFPASWMQPGTAGSPELVLFGGYGYEHDDYLGDTIAVDVKTGVWRTVSRGVGLGPRASALAIWDGCEAIVYGGKIDSSVLTDGAILKP